MLNELFVREIGDLARKAAAPQTVDIGDERLVVIDGKIQSYALPPAHRQHELLTTQDLVEAIRAMGDVEGVVVFVSSGAVHVNFSDADRRDIAVMPLQISGAFRLLREAAGQPLAHAPFVRLLRIGLAGCLPEGFASVFAKVNFARSKQSSSESRHDRESLGRKVEAVVQGIGDLPEEVVVDVPIWAQRPLDGIRQRIRCAITANGESETFTIDPLGDSLVTAEAEAVLELRGRIEEEIKAAELVAHVTVLAGRPIVGRARHD